MAAAATAACICMRVRTQTPPTCDSNAEQLHAAAPAPPVAAFYMATDTEHSPFSSASLLCESTNASAVDYRCFRPSPPPPTDSDAGLDSARFNAALHFKRPVTCTTDLPTLPTAADLACIRKTFKWDAFQLIAAGCILKGESVLVCAHTSSGKTVVGEFAVARALAAGQRILYAKFHWCRTGKL